MNWNGIRLVAEAIVFGLLAGGVILVILNGGWTFRS